jgi:cytochrome c553
MKLIWITAAVLGLTACSGNDEAPQDLGETIDISSISLEPKAGTGRWYTQEERVRGKEVFRANCAGCHGQNAESTPNWKTVAENGQYPPPPLNGTAHAWHHPLSVLKMVIEQGGEPVGGVMPAWGDTLSDRQIIDVIASFQSYWPDDTYQLWLEREQSRGDSQ